MIRIRRFGFLTAGRKEGNARRSMEQAFSTAPSPPQEDECAKTGVCFFLATVVFQRVSCWCSYSKMTPLCSGGASDRVLRSWVPERVTWEWGWAWTVYAKASICGLREYVRLPTCVRWSALPHRETKWHASKFGGNPPRHRKRSEKQA